jgi:hypothetical protein
MEKLLVSPAGPSGPRSSNSSDIEKLPIAPLSRKDPTSIFPRPATPHRPPSWAGEAQRSLLSDPLNGALKPHPKSKFLAAHLPGAPGGGYR